MTLLNDPAFFEIAQGLAERILKEGGKSDSERIKLGIQLCLAREPDEKEVAILQSFLNKQRTVFSKIDALPLSQVVQRVQGPAVNAALHSEQAAWTMLARVILNLDETITRE